MKDATPEIQEAITTENGREETGRVIENEIGTGIEIGIGTETTETGTGTGTGTEAEIETEEEIETEAEMEGAIEAGAGNVHEGTGTGIGIGIAAVKGAEAGKELEEAVSDAVPAGWLFERPQPHSFKHHSQFISISQRLLQRSP